MVHGGFTEDIRKNILNNEDSYNANEIRMLPQPTALIIDFDKCFLPKPLIKKPINGSKGIK